MSKVLVKIFDNWADEFDVEGFIVLDQTEYEEGVEKVKKYFEENGSVELYFGTNEALEYNGFNRWMRALDVEEITDEDAYVLDNLFGGEHGTIVTWDYMIETVDEYFAEEAEYADEDEDEDD